MEVTVALKNPPPEAKGWVFTVFSHDETNRIGSAYLSINEPITLQVPVDWFPLYSSIALFSAPSTMPIYEITNVPSLYWYANYDASLPLITEPGSYYFNVATRQFEEIAPPTDGEGVGISLKAGGNWVVYTGRAQASLVALDSIAAYLAPGEGVWYWNNYYNVYEIMQAPGYPVYDRTDMVPYGVYWIQVTQNCIWTYGADATPPTSVYLYSDRFNIVPYCGPTQAVELALASILGYLDVVWYYDNATKEWFFYAPGAPSDLTIMVKNNTYHVKVTRACEWIFEVPEVVPCEITIDAPDSAAEGEKVSVSALLKNVSSYGSMYKTEISAVPDLFPAFRIGTIEKYIDSGESFTAYGSFTMPASNTTILIGVERWAVDHWIYDNSASRAVSLEVVPEFRGTISKKELDYDETRRAIPVY